MSWLILFASAASIVVALSLMFRTHGGPFQGQPGNESTLLNVERPLPIQHYDLEAAKSLQSQHDQMLKALETSLERARKICEEMQPAHSAVVELNLAKLALDQAEKHGSRMNAEQLQELVNYISIALERARWFLDHHGQDRYDVSVREYLEHQSRRLGRLTGTQSKQP